MAGFWSLITVLLIAARQSIAAPLISERGGDISSDLLNKFNLFSQYSAAAYCSGNNDSPNTTVSCPYGNCPLVHSARTSTLHEFQNSLITDVTGFVAADHTNKLIVVAFRGSASIQNWIANFDITAVPTDLCPGCTAHKGFWTSWTEARKSVLDAIKTSCKTNPDYALVLTGHSLGGAIASLAAAELRKSGYSAALYTYGAPRFASSRLSDFISGQTGGNYRITHYNDPVPRLPPIPFNFVHVSPEYYINRPNFKTVGSRDFRIYGGNVNFGGNAAWLLTDFIAHTWYLGDIALCYKKHFLEGRGVEDGMG